MTADAEHEESKTGTFERRILQAFEAGMAGEKSPVLEHRVPGPPRQAIADVKQPPFDAMGLVVCQGVQTLYGTAVYCAPDAVVTAKHTFHVANIKGAWLYIGFDAKKNPVTAARVSSMAVHPTLDLAVLIIDAPPRKALPFPGVRLADKQTVSIAGYGIPYSDGSMQLTAGTGMVTDATDHLLGYAITTANGDSGAPVLMRAANGDYAVVGIHTSGDTGLPSGSNFGVPMTDLYVAELTQLLASARQNSAH